ncbi:alpha/beta hydrolase [Spongiactinospora sp. TRM90649]|uniref:alpha/beta hydrolase family protein n=1 Tax=Spongiactinospora sp. TRM90649 TaxID=3031114 RepID=UPI0023F74488|nr:alpha/beta hydrolase [Spongiactinospora sp. TRM90649]MDF5754230.1 alpha/beta hydrolase [Spongiactinospora sp. TRM90649]
MAGHVVVILGPAPEADPGLLAEVAERESAALGVAGEVRVADDAVAFAAELDAAGARPGVAVVALPGPDSRARALIGRGTPFDSRLVWLDLARADRVPAADATHLHGRGVWGLAWAIRHAVHRTAGAGRRVPYGADPDQYGELIMPIGVDALPGPPAVAMLLHGGFYRSIWGADLMDALAVDLARRGFAVWNVEYRRPDLHGWDATVADVAAAHAALGDLGAPLDLGRVAVIGHSAGGQLALRLAADRWAGDGGIALGVSLAGLLDLDECDARELSGGATAGALGGGHDRLPAVYAASSPLARVPLGGPQLVVQGAQDDLDLIDFNRRYTRAAEAAGDHVTYLEQPGDHFSVIDPAAGIWAATAAEMAARLGVTARG